MSSGELVIGVIVAILVTTAILAGIGFYMVVHKSNRERDTEELSKIALSGKYSATLRPVADSLAEKKPNFAELQAWLNTQGMDENQQDKYLVEWQKTINQNIKTISDGDLTGITTYRIELGPKDKKLCEFLHPDHFITRDQINRNAEILPPYCLGSDSVVIPKLPWDNTDGSSGWKAVVPMDGKYEVPDWRQVV
ncbi:MAG: hypothetical protein FWC15_03780 [Fibromonadales bacterium]|nr:hypothetical protein [Fibromonadales bacterium]